MENLNYVNNSEQLVIQHKNITASVSKDRQHHIAILWYLQKFQKPAHSNIKTYTLRVLNTSLYHGGGDLEQ